MEISIVNQNLSAAVKDPLLKNRSDAEFDREDFIYEQPMKFDGFESKRTYSRSDQAKNADTYEASAEKENARTYSPEDLLTESEKNSRPISMFSSFGSKNSRTAIMIDPFFYQRLQNDPQLYKKYSEEIESIKRSASSSSGGGKETVSIYYIDKDGRINCTTFTKTKSRRSSVQTAAERLAKIKLKNAKRKKLKQELEKKLSKRKEQELRLKGEKKKAQKEKTKRNSKKNTSLEYNMLKNAANKKSGGVSFSVGFSSYDPLQTESRKQTERI